MGTTRLEAFSDGVLAIIITIMVLELRVPHDPTLTALGALLPVLLMIAIPAAFVRPAIADALYVTVSLIWLIPDRRIERAIRAPAPADGAEDA